MNSLKLKGFKLWPQNEEMQVGAEHSHVCGKVIQKITRLGDTGRLQWTSELRAEAVARVGHSVRAVSRQSEPS
jgi:hypothetical protein